MLLRGKLSHVKTNLCHEVFCHLTLYAVDFRKGFHDIVVWCKHCPDLLVKYAHLLLCAGDVAQYQLQHEDLMSRESASTCLKYVLGACLYALVVHTHNIVHGYLPS